MKTFIFKYVLIFLFIFSFSYGQNEIENTKLRVSSDNILNRGGILYHIDDYLSSSNPKPFTGEVFVLSSKKDFKNSLGNNWGTKGNFENFIVSEYSVKNGIKHGYYISWNVEDNFIKDKGEYILGKKNGLWYESYIFKGEKEPKLIFYKNGKKDGLYKRYDNKNKLIEIGQFLNDNKEGIWIYRSYKLEFYKNGINKNPNKSDREILKKSEEYKNLISEFNKPLEIKN